jgi:hypothetical protein
MTLVREHGTKGPGNPHKHRSRNRASCKPEEETCPGLKFGVSLLLLRSDQGLETGDHVEKFLVDATVTQTSAPQQRWRDREPRPSLSWAVYASTAHVAVLAQEG